jgi:hypothetical protein
MLALQGFKQGLQNPFWESTDVNFVSGGMYSNFEANGWSQKYKWWIQTTVAADDTFSVSIF